jgi:phage terminase large subunit-like protein
MKKITLNRENLEKLPLEELTKILAGLEDVHLARQREDMQEFARAIEVPGTPSPFSKSDLRKLIERKRAINLSKRRTHDVEHEELVEPEGADEFYATKLEPALHHDLIMEAIQGLIEEEPVRERFLNGFPVGTVAQGVILCLPPGSAKSTYSSVVAPAWLCGRYDGIDVICTAYASSLAKRFGRRVREICRSPGFTEIMGVTLTGDNQAVDEFSFTNGSTYTALGILGGVTGKRADLLICDDLLAGREEAESEIIRTKTIEALKDDAFTRLKPGGKAVLIGTRWHAADPIGWVLSGPPDHLRPEHQPREWEGQSGLWKGADGRTWLVLSIPLIAEYRDDPLDRKPGDVLWPEWFKPDFVEIAKAQGARSWNSLYQQRPSSSEGNILLRSLWRCWPHGEAYPSEVQRRGHKDELPANIAQVTLVYDTAIEDGEDNDETAMTAWASFGLPPDFARPDDQRRAPKNAREDQLQQNLLLIGAWSAKVLSVNLIDHVEEHVRHFKPDNIVVEKRASGHFLLQELRRRRLRWMEGSYVRDVKVFDWLPEGPPGTKGKIPRAHSAAVLMQGGTVWYVPGEKTERVLKQCAAFPNGDYFDLVDTVTCMLLWSRKINLLEMPFDILDEDEERQVSADGAERWRDAPRLYGRTGAGKPRQPAFGERRRLYG